MKEVENMLVKTRFFGEVDIEDEKILTFDNGIMGFEDMKRWTLIYDIEYGRACSSCNQPIYCYSSI